MKLLWTKISIASFLFLSISYAFQSKDRDFFRVIDSTGSNQSKPQGSISFVQHVQIAKQSGLKTPNKFFLPVIVAYPKGETLAYSLDSVQNYIFGDHIGSLSHYYSEVSYGKFQLTGKVYAVIESQYSISDLDSISKTNAPIRFITKEIFAWAEDNLDLLQFDNDGPDGIPNSGDDDGYMDAFAYNVIGYMDGSYGTTQINSSVSWSDNNTKKHTTIDGNYLRKGSIATMVGMIDIQTWAHEFGHILGIDDYYDDSRGGGGTTRIRTAGLGTWSLMASGARPMAWTKIQLGWIVPTILTQNTKNLSIPNIESNPYVLKIYQDDYHSDQYFLIENRQNSASNYPQYVNDSGLLIWHVNEKKESNFTEVPYRQIVLEEADGRNDMQQNWQQNNYGDDGDLFPGSSNNTEFSDFTYPNARYPVIYGGGYSGISIKNISQSALTMTADIEIKERLGYAIHNDNPFNLDYEVVWKNDTETWAGVLFTSSDAGYITEIDVNFFWECNDEATYEVYIYDQFDGSSPSSLIYQSDTYNLACKDRDGFHPIYIDNVPISANDNFFVVIRAVTNNRIIFLSRPRKRGVSQDPDNYDKSFVSENGTTFNKTQDLAIRSKISYEKIDHNKNKNKGPVISIINDITVPEDSSVVINLDVFDTEGDSIILYTKAVTSNKYWEPSSVKDSLFSSTLTLIPDTNWHGTANIEVIASDGAWYDTTSFKFIVTSVNDIAKVEDITIEEDSRIIINLTSTANVSGSRYYGLSIVADTNVFFMGLDNETGGFTVICDPKQPWICLKPTYTNASQRELLLFPISNWYGTSDIKIYVDTDNEEGAWHDLKKDSTSFKLTVTPINDIPSDFEWISTALDTINITQNNLTDNYTLQWTASTDAADGDSITYLIYARTGVNPAQEVYDTTSTSLLIPYQEFLQKTFEQIPMLSRATVKFSVRATDGIDTVKVTGDDRVVFVNRSDYLSTESERIPTEFALHENYPNPFNPTTTLRFDLPEVNDITLTIYNMLGQKVRIFDMNDTPAGYHSIKWDATNDYGDPVGAGVYLYQLQSKDFVKTRKMVLLK